MKITPDSSLFTALSNFPDAAQARQAAERRAAAREAAVDDGGRRGGDARDALAQEVRRRRQADVGQAETGQAQTGSGSKFAAEVADSRKTQSAFNSPDAGDGSGNAFRREVPNVESKPRFIRMGQLIDIKV